MESLQYPIGRWHKPELISTEQRKACIQTLRDFPEQLLPMVSGVSNAVLDAPYRPGGWTLRQLIHHLADSHINAYCRCRLCLTEPGSQLRPYDEKLWANLPDAKSLPVTASLDILAGIHRRWSALLKYLDPDDFHRSLYHPETGEYLSLDHLLSHYDWHCRHHLAQIRNAVGG